MQTPRRVLAFIAAVTILSGTLTPVYANEVDIDISGLLDDDVTLGLSVDDVTKQEQGSWYNFEDGTLTLFGQLPDTDYGSFAALAGIDAADVKKVVIARDTTAGSLLHGAFDNFTALESIEGLDNLDTSNVTDMGNMFSFCFSLTSLDLSGFDTSSVTDMRNVFNGCSSLTSLDLSGFDTSNVTDMYGMFYGCSSLTSLDLSGFDTSNVTDMGDMFMYCDKLTSLKLPAGFVVTEDMLLPNKSDDYKGWAKSGTETVISGTGEYAVFTASVGEYVHVINKWYTFEDGTLTLFGDLPATNGYSFATLAGIDAADVKKVVIARDTTAGTSLQGAFWGFSSLESIEGLEYLDTSNVTDMRGMFIYCSSLTSLDLSGFDTSNVTDMSNMFYGCGRLTSLDLSGFDTSNVTDMGYMFMYCDKLTSLKLPAGFVVTEDMELPNTSGGYYKGWAKSGTETVISGTGEYAAFTASAGEYVRVINKWYTFEDGTLTLFGDLPDTNNGSFAVLAGIDAADVKKVVIARDTTAGTSLQGAFWGFSSLESIEGLEYLDTSSVTDMRNMFIYCGSLTSVDLSGFDTSNVTDMGNMFYSCGSLTSVDLSGFDTSNVTNMGNMFNGCDRLTSLDLSGFDTSNVTDMGYMFYYCDKLTSLKLPAGFVVTEDMKLSNKYDDYKGWAKSGTETVISGTGEYAVFTASAGEYVRVINKWYTFEDGTLTLFGDLPATNGYSFATLAGIDAADVKKVVIARGTTAGTSLQGAFWGFSSLESIEGLEYLDTSNVTDMYGMFYACSNLTSVDLSGFDTSNVTDMGDMFSYCDKLTSLKLPAGFVVTEDMKLSNKYDVYKGWAKSGTETVISGTGEYAAFTASAGEYVRVINKWYTFEDGTLTLSGDLPGTNNGSFAKLAGIDAADVKKVVIARETTASTFLRDAFSSFASLESIEGLDNLDTSNVTDMCGMFEGCSSLTSLDLSGFDTSNVTNMYGMFNGCSSLTSVDLSGFDTSNVTDMSSMFFNCNSLTSVDLSGFDTSNVTDMYGMFYVCSSLTSLDLSGFDTSNVTDMRDMFFNCINLTSVDLTGFVTSNVTEMRHMFCYCDNLTSLKLPAGFGVTEDMKLSNKSDDYKGWAKSGTETVISGTGEYAAFNAASAGEYVHVSAKWYTFEDGTLTLFGELPDTNGYSFADMAGIDAADVKKIVIDRDTTAGTSLNYAFDSFTSLESIEGLDNLNTSNVTDMCGMFFNCGRLTSLDLSGFDTSNVTDMYVMFYYCGKLTSLKLPAGFGVTEDMYLLNKSDVYKGWAKSGTETVISGTGEYAAFTASAGEYVRVINKWYTFEDGTLTLFGELPDTDYGSFADMAGINEEDVKKVVIKPGTTVGTFLASAFANFTSLESIEGLDNLDTSNVNNMNHMFAGCYKLTSLDLSKFNTSKVTDMSGMFYCCYKLTSLDLSKFNTSQVTDMYVMFYGCGSLTSLDLSGFDTSNLTNTDYMFSYCDNLTSLKLPAGFGITANMELPNTSDKYMGWVKSGTGTVVSGTGEFAVFTASAGEYVRVKPVASPTINKIEPGYGKMNITWTAVTGADQYTIHYKTGSAEKTVKRDASRTGALISGIANGTYDVWVTATVGGIESTAQNIRKATLKSYYVECTTTSGMIAGGIKIDWTKFGGATKYRVVCTDKDNKVVGTAETTALTYQWKGLKNNQEYGFYVQPYVDGVYPTFTRTDANDKKYIKWTVPVNAPMITKLSLGNQKVWLYYESVPRATKYYVYYRQDGQTKDTLAGTTTNTKFLVTGLTNGKATQFYVKALVDGKLTPLKRPATRTTRAGMNPTITVTAGQAALKWTKYTDCKASATKYKVVFVDANYKQIDTRETSNLAFTWKDKRLVKGKKYGFYVVPYVNGEYIPFGLSHANDKANVVFFTAK